MNCPKCNASVNDGAKFCSKCGEGINTLLQVTQNNVPNISGYPSALSDISDTSSGFPQKSPDFPPVVQGFPQQQSIYPQNTPGYPVQQNYPPNGQGFPQQQPIYPQNMQGYPQQQPIYPPNMQSYPQQQPNYPPNLQGYPQQQPNFPPNMQGYPQQGQNLPRQHMKRKKKGGFFRFIAIVLLLVIIFAGVVFAGYHTIMPAKYVYGLAEFISIYTDYDVFDSNMDRFEDAYLTPVMTQPFYQDVTLGLDLDPSTLEMLMNVDPDSAKSTSELIKTLSLQLVTGSSFEEKVLLSDTRFLSNGSPLIGLNLFMKDYNLSLQLPELSDTRLSIDYQDPAVWENLSLLSGSEIAMDPALQTTDIWMAKQVHDKVGIDRGRLKKLILKYALEIFQLLPSSSFEIDRNSEIKLFGEIEELREITISLTPEEMKEVVIGVLTTIEGDDEFYELFVENLDQLLLIMGESNPESAAQLEQIRAELTKETFQKNIADQISAYEDSEIVTNDDAPITTFKMYIDGYRIVRHAVDMKDATGMNGHLIMGLDRVKTGDKISYSINMAGGGDDQALDAAVEWSTEYRASSNDFDMILHGLMDMNMNGYPAKYEFAFESLESSNGGGKSDKTTQGYLNVNIDGEYPTSFQVQLKGTGDVERGKHGAITALNQNAAITLQTAEMPAPLSLKLILKAVYEYNKKLTEPPTAQKVLDMSNATAEDISAYGEEASPKLQELLSVFMPAQE